MKKYLCMILIFAIGCTSKPELTFDQKADTLIRHHLDSVLNDPKSYQPVQFTKIDTLFTDIYDESNSYNIPESGDSRRLIDLIENFNLYEKRVANGYYDNLNKINQRVIDSLKKAYNPKVRGYYVEHTYRATNGFGALTKHTTGFDLDTSLTKVILTHKRD